MFSNLANNRQMFNENMGYELNQHIAQGMQFNKYGEKYHAENEHALLADSSGSEWGSVVEAYSSPSSTKGTGTKASVEGMTSSAYGAAEHRQFNDMVSKYAAARQSYAAAMLGRKRPNDRTRLAMERSLNAQRDMIMAMANKMNAAINTTSGTNARVAMEKNQATLNKYFQDIQAQQLANVSSNKYDEQTISGAIENTSLNMNSMYYHFLVYFVISITLIAFIFNLMVNPEANVMNAIYVVGALFAVYFVTRHYAL
jgi:Mg2+ and Co2+ transporter CorA